MNTGKNQQARSAGGRGSLAEAPAIETVGLVHDRLLGAGRSSGVRALPYTAESISSARPVGSQCAMVHRTVRGYHSRPDRSPQPAFNNNKRPADRNLRGAVRTGGWAF